MKDSVQAATPPLSVDPNNSAVESALIELSETVTQVRQSFQELEQRLEVFLGPAPTEAAAKVLPNEAPGSSVACTFLRAQIERLYRLDANICILRSRL